MSEERMDDIEAGGIEAGDIEAGRAVRDELREHFPSPPFPRARIEARIERTLLTPAVVPPLAFEVPRVREHGKVWAAAIPVLLAAASVALFIAGVEYGRRLGPRVEPSARPATSAPAAGPAMLPLEIQDAGSRYVATLARFSAESESLSEGEREMAREVAMAILYGASLELLREGGEEGVLRSVATLVASKRAAEDAQLKSNPPRIN